ncbi:hypothetical protein KSP39_PZI006627 [Platanthera zijinensis]|uniref:Peptide chain release factor domain-containing protein n=1 Tax=Platanthera zijinensis TaxID=2320716 RepID=A0AAP0GA26_9ASPA
MAERRRLKMSDGEKSCSPIYTRLRQVKEVSVVAEHVEEVRDATGVKRLQADLSALERKVAYSSLWDDPPKAQEIFLAFTDVKDKIKQVDEFKSQEAETIVKLTEELDSIDTGLLEEASKITKELITALNRFEPTQLLLGPYDKEGTIVTSIAGVAGTDAQQSLLPLKLLRSSLPLAPANNRQSPAYVNSRQQSLRSPQSAVASSLQQSPAISNSL